VGESSGCAKSANSQSSLGVSQGIIGTQAVPVADRKLQSSPNAEPQKVSA
jgi:hypothetical protein